MVSFVQDIGGGNKIVWDLDNPNDAEAIGTIISVLFVLLTVALVVLLIYVLFF